MLELVPHSVLSWDFSVLREGVPVAEIDVSWFREKGVLTLDGVQYPVYREHLLSGAYILELNGTQLARAEKPSALFRCFLFEHPGKTYTLQAGTAVFRKFVLLDDDREVGSITPEGPLIRNAMVDLPDNLPLPVQVFLIWLTVILWKRAATRK
ncbi:MAG: hypothetical protein WBW33_21210 [Bryobacteraceae bacterium]